MTKIVQRTVDLRNLPPLTEAQRAQLKKLSEMPDGQIDYSDIPPLPDDFGARAIPNPFLRPPRPIKTPTTVRVDADVLAWLKSQGKGYQTRINAILREKMLTTLGQAQAVRAGKVVRPAKTVSA